MLSVPNHVRSFLASSYGVSPDSSMFISCNEPQRVYVERNGTLHFIDFSSPPNEIRFAPYMLKQELNRQEFNSMPNNLSVTDSREFGANTTPTDTPRWHSVSDTEREIIQKEFRKANAYKTALCQAYKESGFCCYGPACRFAHGESELRLSTQSHPKCKTQLCNKFALYGRCPYGNRCQFIHQRPNNVSFPQPAPSNMENENSGGLFSRSTDFMPRNSFEQRKGIFNDPKTAARPIWPSLPLNSRLENVELASSPPASRPANTVDLWQKMPVTNLSTDGNLDVVSDASESSDKNLGNISNGVGLETPKPLASSPDWHFGTMNAFASSCFPRLQNTSFILRC